jgi:GLPGLI family protein
MEKTYNGETSAKVTKATYDQHLYFFSDNSHYLVQPWVGDTLVIKEEIDHIDWIITNDKKNIAGFNSIKATCFFKGRQYEAWYCPDIAVKAGPWKLNGLPGLILEAKDSKAHVKFEIISLQNLPLAMVSLTTTKKLITKQESSK